MESRIKEIMASTFNVPVGSITSDSSIDSIDSWDSLSHASLVVSLEQGFGVTFKTDEILELMNYKLIKLILEEKLQ